METRLKEKFSLMTLKKLSNVVSELVVGFLTKKTCLVYNNCDDEETYATINISDAAIRFMHSILSINYNRPGSSVPHN